MYVYVRWEDIHKETRVREEERERKRKDTEIDRE